jgi:hypothetical protein
LSRNSAGFFVDRVRETGEDALMLARLARDLPRYLRSPMSPETAKQRFRDGLATRAQRLSTIVERGIYGYSRSPYLKLLRAAGCELGDFKSLLSRDGVEQTLSHLADRGVYLTYEELKGHRETVRGSQRIEFRQQDFDNPLVRPHVLLYTGGSGGRPTRVGYSLEFLAEWAVSVAVMLETFDVRRPGLAFWWPVPTAQTILCGMLGYPVLGWRYPVRPLPALAAGAFRYLALISRLGGFRVPSPEYCGLTAPAPLARWMAEHVRPDRPLVFWTVPSSAARLGIIASELGLDLSGVIFILGGEPVTEVRRKQMEGPGAQVIVGYSAMDVSAPAYGCRVPTAPDDVHVMLDRCVLISRPRPTTSSGPTVDAILATPLSVVVPRIALNTELGDYASTEERDCGCLLGELGARTHLSGIRSFEKLTGEGVTFVRTNLEQIIEQVLPARFGGTSLDYQLAEEESPTGAARLVLRVSPKVGAVDEARLRQALLVSMGQGSLFQRYQAQIWHGAGTIEIRREEPLATRAGKVLPFHLLGHSRLAGELDRRR